MEFDDDRSDNEDEEEDVSGIVKGNREVME